MTRSSSTREMARILYESRDPVDIYTLHERYKLGPSQILRTVRLFKRISLIEELDQGFIALTKGGRERLWHLRYRLLLDGERPWASIDMERADPAAPYLPDLSKVDRTFFLAKVANGVKPR